MLKGLDQVGIAVTDLNKAVAQYEKFGFKVAERRQLASWGTLQQVVMGIGQDRPLVLMEAKDPSSPMGRFLQRKGEGIYAVVFDVDSLTKTKEGLKAQEINPIEDTVEGRPVLFVHPRDAHGLLIGFVERHKPPKGQGAAFSPRTLYSPKRGVSPAPRRQPQSDKPR